MESNLNLTLKRRFFANTCYVCLSYGKDIKLKRCGKCKMIAYCNREHQVKHWPEHKILCGFLCEKIKTGKVYQFDPNVENDEAWCKAKKETLSSVQTLMSIQVGRKILPFEFEMLTFPRACHICHETDFHKLKDCTDCPDTSFCPKHPRDDNHSAKCKASKFLFDMHGMTINLANIDLITDYGTKIPHDMDEALEIFKSYGDFDENERKITWETLLSDLLTRPYTFFYALQKLPPKSDKLLIHVIGAANCDLYCVDLWHFLLHHNDSLKELKIIFVGSHLTTSSLELQHCYECTKHNRWISIQSVKGYYTHFAAEKSFKKPDYIMRFNLEIHPRMCSLLRTVKLLAKLGCPIFITSSTTDQPKELEERINKALGKKISVFYAGQNPFVGRTPFKQFQSNGYYYSNQYLTIYEKLS